MNVTITPALLKGTITPPPSKSQAHRVLIAAALAGGGTSVIHNLAPSQDILATRRCLTALGAQIDEAGPGAVRVRGLGGAIAEAGPAPVLDCGESGSTLRFLIPVALLVNGAASFTGHGRLMERPMKPYEDLFRERGIAWRLEDGVLTVDGGRGRGRLALEPGEYRLPGNVSSQFFSGLLFTLPLLKGDSLLVSTTPLESVGYVNMTRQAMEAFGVETKWTKEGIFIPGSQTYRPAERTVEADWSQAAFWYAAAGTGSDVTVTGMDEGSIQGDRVILDWGRMIRDEPMSGGAKGLIWGRAGSGPAAPPPQDGPRRHAVSIDVSHAPDLVPPAAAWGALTPGCDLYLKNAARLRMKESDRLSTVTEALTALGAEVIEEPDRLIIRGRETLPGGATVDSRNDHRIAMMAAVAATRCERPVTVAGAECVAKSYPNFWEDYEKLGGRIVRREG